MTAPLGPQPVPTGAAAQGAAASNLVLHRRRAAEGARSGD